MYVNELTEQIRIAVRQGVADAIMEEKKRDQDKILRDTKMLMKSYREMKRYVANTVAEESEITEPEYKQQQGGNATLKLTRETKIQTAMMLMNIDRALEELEAECREKRIEYKFNAFRMRYVEGKTMQEITEEIDCGKNSPDIWCKTMMRKMSVKLFGIKAIRNM